MVWHQRGTGAHSKLSKHAKRRNKASDHAERLPGETASMLARPLRRRQAIDLPFPFF
jgi:hypothetical protein